MFPNEGGFAPRVDVPKPDGADGVPNGDVVDGVFPKADLPGCPNAEAVVDAPKADGAGCGPEAVAISLEPRENVDAGIEPNGDDPKVEIGLPNEEVLPKVDGPGAAPKLPDPPNVDLVCPPKLFPPTLLVDSNFPLG